MTSAQRIATFKTQYKGLLRIPSPMARTTLEARVLAEAQAQCVDDNKTWAALTSGERATYIAAMSVRGAAA